MAYGSFGEIRRAFQSRRAAAAFARGWPLRAMGLLLAYHRWVHPSFVGMNWQCIEKIGATVIESGVPVQIVGVPETKGSV